MSRAPNQPTGKDQRNAEKEGQQQRGQGLKDAGRGPRRSRLAVFNELAEEFWPDALRAAFTGNGGLERCGRRSCKLAGSCQMIYTPRQAARLRRRRTGGCGCEGCVRRCRRLRDDQSHPSGATRDSRPPGHRESRSFRTSRFRTSRRTAEAVGAASGLAGEAQWRIGCRRNLLPAGPLRQRRERPHTRMKRRRQTAIFMPGSCSMVQA